MFKYAFRTFRYIKVNSDILNKAHKNRFFHTSGVKCSIDINQIQSQIPDTPSKSDPLITDIVYNKLGDPTFESLGSWNSMWPPSWIQNIIEVLHVECDIPWWGCIVATTSIIRLMLIPINIKTRKLGAEISNYENITKEFNLKMEKSEVTGDMVEMIYLYKTGLPKLKEKPAPSKLKLFGYFSISLPPFMIMITALIELSKFPVESLKSGGLFWFKDLTVCDPYYILPLLATSSLVALMFATQASTMKVTMPIKIVSCVIPLILLYNICEMPTAATLYWVITSLFTLIFNVIIRIPRVKTYFKIPDQSTSMFANPFSSQYKKVKTLKEGIAKRDYEQWIKAKDAPIPKLFKHDPTKVSLK